MIDLNQPVTIDDIEVWKTARETPNIEFKTAQNNFDSRKLSKYCCALANEGGGRIVLGMTDDRPRRVTGSRAFNQVERTHAGLQNDLGIRVRYDEIQHPDIPATEAANGSRVLVFSVGSRRRSEAVNYDGSYWVRNGEELQPMSGAQLRAIHDELITDFSAEVCARATLEHLAPAAIETLRRLWIAKSGNRTLANVADEQLLRDAELIDDEGITYAALLLLGTRAALGRFLAQAEVIWEYRNTDAQINYDFREEYREGFLLYADRLWNTINNHNFPQSIQHGFVMRDIRPFNERVTREAILNAVVHRNYHLPSSTFVKQYPRTLEVISPGGLPPGVTLENVLTQQAPRNRRLAEVTARCGLIERSGQGIDLMFQTAIREGKPLPDYSGTSEHLVHLTLQGTIQDPQFLLFLEKVGPATLETFSTDDFLALDAVHRHQKLDEPLKARAEWLRQQGILEKAGKGRGVHFILARELYENTEEDNEQVEKPTEVKGIERETNKMQLLRHIESHQEKGIRFAELQKVLPSLNGNQVQYLLRTLREEGKVHSRGKTNAATWYPGPSPASAENNE